MVYNKNSYKSYCEEATEEYMFARGFIGDSIGVKSFVISKQKFYRVILVGMGEAICIYS